MTYRVIPVLIFLLGILLACTPTANKSSLPSRYTIRLNEGTNIALSLSPDKKTLVFDLQGRLWVLPVEGGDAQPITDYLGGSHAPHWSPTGEKIAFHSYRDGNFHIYTVMPDGSALTQLTQGLTDNREPFWDPDGKHLYFSSDRGGSYGVFILNTETGQIRAMADSAGHNEYYPVGSSKGALAYVKNGNTLVIDHRENEASMPTTYPSPFELGAPVFTPGGDSLLVQGISQSHTYWQILDLQSGRWDTLEVASEDIFPFRASWQTGTTFYYTADGKILRYEGTSSTPTTVPFQAEVEMNRPTYKRREYHFSDTSSQPVLGIRNPVVSPDGSGLVFTALGDLWAVDMLGKKTQLTDDKYVDLDPVFSPNGQKLAFVSDRGGSMDIWVMDLGTGDLSPVTDLKDDLMYPAWSPDGRRIAFVKTSRLNAWGRSTLHIVELETGRITQFFDQIFVPSIPQWSPDGTHIMLAGLQANSSRFREGRNELLLINLPDSSYSYVPVPGGAAIATRGKNGPIWSPDGRHLALILQGELHIQEISPEMEFLGSPQKLLEGLSDVPSWTANGESIWVLQTDQLVEVDLSGRASTLPMEMEWNPDIPADSYVLQVGRMFNGVEDSYQENLDIFIQGNRIQGIQPRATSYPTGWEVVDAQHLTAIPGLFEMHVHQSEVVGEVLGRSWLAYGITSVREVGANPYDVLARKEAWESGRRRGPRQFYTGGLTDGNRIYYGLANSIQDTIQLKKELERAIRLKYDLIKTYVRMPDSWQKMVVSFAHKNGIPVSSHELYPAVAYGVDAVEHLLGTSRRGYSLKQSRIQYVYDDVRDLLAKTGMSITPTLGLGGGIVPFLSYDASLLEDPLYLSLYSNELRGNFEGFVTARQQQNLAGQRYTFKNQQHFLRELLDAGGIITAGTDAPFLPYGWALHAELEIYVDAGFSPFEALQCATLTAARSMGLDGDLGSIEPGKLADISLVNGDPLSHIDDARKVEWVIANGKKLKVADLIE